MITREDVINARMKGMTAEEALKFIHDYCIEKGKDEYWTNIFLTIIFRLGQYESYLNYVIKYYLIKYNIIEIYYNNKLISVF